MCSKSKVSFLRRVYIAYLVRIGVNSVPAIMEQSGMNRRTIQDAIIGMGDVGIECEHRGGRKAGGYIIVSWGPIREDWVAKNLSYIESVLCLTVNGTK